MKTRTLLVSALALAAVATVTAVAASRSPQLQPLTLAEMVNHLEAKYPGEVITIRFDAGDEKGPHYHVDMRFRQSGLARVDVDAVTLKLASRDEASLPAGAASLAEAAALIAAELPGQVKAVELDSALDVRAHYDIDVLLPQGGVAQLELDPSTRRIGWREPAIVGL